MRLILISVITLSIAAAVGLGLTWRSATNGVDFSALTIGAWRALPRTGTSDIDPYARAGVARSGELPVGAGDGVTFMAKTDVNGRALDGRCDVVVSGTTPAARFWTLTLYDTDGELTANVLHRYGFTSEEIVRNADGSFDLHVAARARAGNWLPTGGLDRYVLALRFYDTPVGMATRSQRDAPLPAVSTVSCP